MNQGEFFEVLGYLSSAKRNTKLDVETHPRMQRRFENKYYQKTGVHPVEDNVNYYVWDPNKDKWGIEMRIYFNGNLSTMPTTLRRMRVSSRPGSGYAHRINNNRFVWRLIDYGFLLGNSQDMTRIRNRVLTDYQSVFENGRSIV